MDSQEISSVFRRTTHESSSQNTCCCCLAENRSMINLRTCKHAEFLQDLHKMGLSKLTVCRICHSMLSKIQIFQNQVRDSCMVLKKQIRCSTTPKLNNLQQSDTKTYTLSEESEQDLELEIKDEPAPSPASEAAPFEFVTDVKVEHESSSSDFENTLPLSEVKKTEDSKSKPKKTRRLPELKTFAIDDKYKGKITGYKLDREELEEEREKESKKESYLKLPFKCESCVKGFDHENTLKTHISKQHSQKKSGIECDICKTILGPASYKEHARRHYRRYECVVCGKRAQDIYSISQHFNQHHHEAGAISQEFQCDQCDFTTDSNRVYRYHRDKHKQKQQCTVCANTYVSVASLRIHMLHVHKQSARVYTCAQCDKSYSSKSGLHNHNASAHETARAYCAACRAHFRTRTGLAHHLRTHSAHLTPHNKKFACNKCNGAFLTRTALQEHVDWDHLKTVKHACPKCKKAFKSAATMRNHVNFVHELRRPPRDKICDYCGRGFTTFAILRCHIRTHTGERPLSCMHCDATFAHSAALYTHNKILHKHKPR